MPEAGLAFSDAELAAYVAVARCESAVLLNERLNLSRQTFSAVVEPLPPQQLVCVDPERVREIWPFVAPLLKQAIAKTGLAAFATVERDILDGSSLLWVAWNGGRIAAVASTSVQQTDAGKVCVITACAGAGMALWLPLIRGIEAYAQAEDCCCVRIFGRRGWSRILEGYEQTFAIMDKRLPQEVTPAPDVSPIAEATYLR
jgi:hypothetical protein